MIGYFRPIHINRCLLPRRQNLHICFSARSLFLWSFKCPGIPVTASVITSVPIHPVYGIPGMGKRYILPVYRIAVYQPYIMIDKLPACVQIDDCSHISPPSVSTQFCTELF